MIARLSLVLFLFLPAILSAGRFGNAVDLSSPQYLYKPPINSLRDLRFKNLSYPLLGEVRRLKNGKFHKGYTEDSGYEDIELNKVWFFNDPDGGLQKALVSLSITGAGGSSFNEGILLLIEMRNNRAVVTEELDYDLQTPNTGDSFDPVRRTIRIRARSNDGSAHCCPENVDVVTFRWKSGKFVQTSARTIALGQPDYVRQANPR